MSGWMKHAVATAMVAASAAATAPANAEDVFIKIDGIQGDSLDAKHKGDSDVLSWSWGASSTVNAATGAAAGRPQFKELTITKKIDSASPRLLSALSNGQRIPSLMLVVRKAGGSQQEYVRIRLTDVIVSALSVAGTGKTGADAPTEEIKFNFSQCEYSYFAQRADGSLGPEIKMGWSVKANAKL